MLMIRLIFVLLVITVLVSLGLYLLQNNRKYLAFCKQTFKFTLFFLVAVAVLFLLRRVLYV